MFLPHFDVFCDLLLNRRTATWNLFVLYNKETKINKSVFISKEDTKQGRDGFLRARKKWFDVICYLYKMEQTDWFLGAATNCDWLRKFSAILNFFSFGWWRQSCVCPLIDHRQKPIKIREYLGLLYKLSWNRPFYSSWKVTKLLHETEA